MSKYCAAYINDEDLEIIFSDDLDDLINNSPPNTEIFSIYGYGLQVEKRNFNAIFDDLERCEDSDKVSMKGFFISSLSRKIYSEYVDISNVGFIPAISTLIYLSDKIYYVNFENNEVIDLNEYSRICDDKLCDEIAKDILIDLDIDYKE